MSIRGIVPCSEVSPVEGTHAKVVPSVGGWRNKSVTHHLFAVKGEPLKSTQGCCSRNDVRECNKGLTTIPRRLQGHDRDNFPVGRE